MPESLWFDILRMDRIRSAVEDSGQSFYDPDTIENYDEDIPTTSTRFNF